MNAGNCQICGRRKALKKDGTIIMHHFKGDICLGAYNPPLSVSMDAIPEAIEHHRRQSDRYQGRMRRHKEDRENMPLSADFWESWAKTSREITRLNGRLLRLQNKAIREAREARVARDGALVSIAYWFGDIN